MPLESETPHTLSTLPISVALHCTGTMESPRAALDVHPTSQLPLRPFRTQVAVKAGAGPCIRLDKLKTMRELFEGADTTKCECIQIV
jgi:hypothetical protein